MHGLTIATATLALIAADGAMAQNGPGAPYPVPGRVETATTVAATAPASPPPRAARPPRWGTKIGGRWWAGANAPGGWDAYRPPSRGWALPPYWNAPRFRVQDWDRYGLARPLPGRNWVRYYDDAVLIDARGSVYDSAGDVDWDRFDRRDYVQGAPTYGARTYEGRGDNGLGGAAIGAVAGGVAGNMIAGRGNKLGGTLIGAGVGAAAGYALDRAEDRRAPSPPPYRHRRDEGRGYGGYADGYDYPVAPPHAPPPPPSRWVSPDGATTVTTSIGGPAGGYGYTNPDGSTTTVTVQTTPVVTTTTTEYYDAPVTYRRRALRSKRVGTKLIRAR